MTLGGSRSSSTLLAMRVLRAFAERNDWGVRELARDLGVSPTKLHRVVTALCVEGFVVQDQASRRYSLGPSSHSIAILILQQIGVRDIARPIMEQLMEDVGESVLLSEYDRFQSAICFIEQIQCRNALRYVVELGKPHPLHIGSTGRVVLANLGEPERESVLRELVNRDVGAWPAQRVRKLDAQLEEIRSAGYAWSLGERSAGVAGVAVPVWWPNGRLFGGLSVSVPERRFSNEVLLRLVPRLTRAAAELSGSMGRIRDREGQDVDD